MAAHAQSDLVLVLVTKKTEPSVIRHQSLMDGKILTIRAIS